MNCISLILYRIRYIGMIFLQVSLKEEFLDKNVHFLMLIIVDAYMEHRLFSTFKRR